MNQQILTFILAIFSIFLINCFPKTSTPRICTDGSICSDSPEIKSFDDGTGCYRNLRIVNNDYDEAINEGNNYKALYEKFKNELITESEVDYQSQIKRVKRAIRILESKKSDYKKIRNRCHGDVYRAAKSRLKSIRSEKRKLKKLLAIVHDWIKVANEKEDEKEKEKEEIKEEDDEEKEKGKTYITFLKTQILCQKGNKKACNYLEKIGNHYCESYEWFMVNIDNKFDKKHCCIYFPRTRKKNPSSYTDADAKKFPLKYDLRISPSSIYKGKHFKKHQKLMKKREGSVLAIYKKCQKNSNCKKHQKKFKKFCNSIRFLSICTSYTFCKYDLTEGCFPK